METQTIFLKMALVQMGFVEERDGAAISEICDEYRQMVERVVTKTRMTRSKVEEMLLQSVTSSKLKVESMGQVKGMTMRVRASIITAANTISARYPSETEPIKT